MCSSGMLCSVDCWLITGASWTASPYKTGPIDCPETSVTNHQTTLRNIPEEQRSHFHAGANLRARIDVNCKCLNLRFKPAGSILQQGRLTNTFKVHILLDIQFQLQHEHFTLLSHCFIACNPATEKIAFII